MGDPLDEVPWPDDVKEKVHEVIDAVAHYSTSLVLDDEKIQTSRYGAILDAVFELAELASGGNRRREEVARLTTEALNRAIIASRKLSR